MKNRLKYYHFNMIEISFALLVIAIGVTTIFGLVPIGSLSHAQAVNQNQAADAAENALNKLAADVQLDWADMITAKEITDNHSNFTHLDTEDSSSFLDPANWLHVNTGSNISTQESGLYKYTQSGTKGNLYRFIQVTTMNDAAKHIDFDAIVRVWQKTIDKRGYDSGANTKENVVMLNIEVSWPASLKIERRHKAYYKMEVFCYSCEVK